MDRTFVIAESGATWEADLEKAYRSIHAAAACGADAWKVQWVSDPEKMAARRNDPSLAAAYRRYLAWPREWHEKLKARCDAAGIEYMCTTYLQEDIETIAPLVKRFKVSSFEACSWDFVVAHLPYCSGERSLIISNGLGKKPTHLHRDIVNLYCVSGYPCPINELNLACLWEWCQLEDRRVSSYNGLSDHTTSTLTGALAVAAGAVVIEKHVRLLSTPTDNPDYAHSLIMNGDGLKVFSDGNMLIEEGWPPFADYVSNIREAERAMGDGERKVMPCEEGNLKYRVRA